MKKFITITIFAVIMVLATYLSFTYFATYSEGVRAGELIKLSKKGVVFKTWEGEISQGISGAMIFSFSVLDSDKAVTDSLQSYQGEYVKVTYIERYRTFPWWGDTHYFITKVEKEPAPFNHK